MHGVTISAMCRRLLGWPGAPGVAVLGELGWAPLAMEAKRLQYGLFAWLSSAGAHSARCRLATRVFQFALHCPNSWAHSTAQKLRIDGVVLPSSFGIGLGVRMGQVGCHFPPSVNGHWPVVAIIPSMMADVLVIAKCIALNVSVVPQTGRFCTASAHAPCLSCIANNG